MTTPTIKRIVCLANSRKYGGRCVAGKELLADGRAGGWIRPVSARDGEAVSERERCYADGDDPRVLDIIEVPLISPRPKTYQRENWLLNPNVRWANVGRTAWDDLQDMLDRDESLWQNGHSSSAGQNDRVPIDDTEAIADSLRLIRVDALTVTVSEPLHPSANFPVLRGRFRYNGDDYGLRITDAETESGSLKLEYRDYNVGARYLVVSLGEPFEGHAYKIIATIIKP